MPKRIRLRALTTEENVAINRIAASRKEPLRRVQRARIIKSMADDPNLTASDAGQRAGSMKLRNTTPNSGKKGEHNLGLSGAAATDTGYLC